MRVAVDVSQTCVQRAGCAWHADACARALADALGPENVVLYHHFGEWINLDTNRGTFIEGCDQPFAGMNPSEAKSAWAAIERGELALPGAPQIVHSNSFMAPRIPRAKLVYTIHDLCFWTHPEFTTETNRILCQRQALKALRNADAFIFVSESSQADFEALLPGWMSERRRSNAVISLGTRFPARHQTSSAQRFGNSRSPWLHVGTLEPRKNIIGVLAAYRKYLKHSVVKRPLVFAGASGWLSAAEQQELEEACETLAVQSLGYVDEEALQRLYGEAFALLSLSHYEGFGLPICEAGAFALPVVARNSPSLEQARRAPESIDPVEEMLELESAFNKYQEAAQSSSLRSELWNFSSLAQNLMNLYRLLLA